MNYSQFNQFPFNSFETTDSSCNPLPLSIATLGLLSPTNEFSESLALLGLNVYCPELITNFDLIPISDGFYSDISLTKIDFIFECPYQSSAYNLLVFGLLKEPCQYIDIVSGSNNFIDIEFDEKEKLKIKTIEVGENYETSLTIQSLLSSNNFSGSFSSVELLTTILLENEFYEGSLLSYSLDTLIEISFNEIAGENLNLELDVVTPIGFDFNDGSIFDFDFENAVNLSANYTEGQLLLVEIKTHRVESSTCDPAKWVFNAISFNKYSGPCGLFFEPAFVSGESSEADILVSSLSQIELLISDGSSLEIDFNSLITIDSSFTDGSELSIVFKESEEQIYLTSQFFTGTTLSSFIRFDKKAYGSGEIDVLTDSRRVVIVTIKMLNRKWSDTKLIETITLEKIRVLSRTVKALEPSIRVISRIKETKIPAITIKIKDHR